MDEERSHEDRQEQDLRDTAVEADEDRHSADDLGQYDRPGEDGRKTDRTEEAFETGYGEDRHLEVGVSDEHQAERRAQGEDAVRCKTIVDHLELLLAGV